MKKPHPGAGILNTINSNAIFPLSFFAFVADLFFTEITFTFNPYTGN